MSELRKNMARELMERFDSNPVFIDEMKRLNDEQLEAHKKALENVMLSGTGIVMTSTPRVWETTKRTKRELGQVHDDSATGGRYGKLSSITHGESTKNEFEGVSWQKGDDGDYVAISDTYDRSGLTLSRDEILALARWAIKHLGDKP